MAFSNRRQRKNNLWFQVCELQRNLEDTMLKVQAAQRQAEEAANLKQELQEKQQEVFNLKNQLQDEKLKRYHEMLENHTFVCQKFF